MLQMNGIFNAPIGKLFGIPTLAFSDTENDIWANRISFSLTKHVFCPTCFSQVNKANWNNQIFYPSYHELAYLSPKYFTIKRKPTDNFLLRFVGWTAGHDIGEKCLSDNQKIEIVNTLKEKGNVYISSEAPLPDELKKYSYNFSPSEIHDFMTSCRLVIGESATMASEAACLGIPAIFISNTGRGYTTELDKTYGLIKHFTLKEWEQTIHTINHWATQNLVNEWQEKRRKMLTDKIELTDFIVDLILGYPRSIDSFKNKEYLRKYNIISKF